MAGFGHFMSSVGIHLKPKITTNEDSYGNKSTFAGVSVPIMGNIGFRISEDSNVRFGRFKDPRAALRTAQQNKVVIPPNSGISSKHPVPISTRGNVQKQGSGYDELKQAHLASGTLFEDSDFPAVETSIFYSQPGGSRFQWKRPKEICQNPKFVTDGTSRFDVKQGELGDCWLLAAVANLSLHQDLLDQVMPTDQNFEKDYCGLFRFHFWRFGEWVEVVIDDRLPVRGNNLVFMHSIDKNEFWSALLEKAYAKLFGSYENLKGGSTIEALEDFTGGLAEFYDLRGQEPPNMTKILLSSYARNSLMACSIEADPNVTEARQQNGLIKGHAYSITKVAMLQQKQQEVMLIRIRNPWGNEAEWKGRWSDASSEWSKISDKQKRELGLKFDADGEFWMSYQDFIGEFQKLEICCLGPQSLSGSSDSNKITFQMTMEHGCWQPGVSAGGCRNFLESFWTNPQYIVNVEDGDDDDNEDVGTLIVGLMQKNRRKMRSQGADLLTIGFMVYKLKENTTGPLGIEFFKYNSAVAKSAAFINSREVTGRFRLPPGRYVIVPSTFQKNEQADFLLRIFSEKIRTTEQMDDTIGMEDTPEENKPEPINESQVAALKRAFDKVCGTDGSITADELVDILNVAFTKDFAFEGFSVEACRSLIAMMDFDRSGSLDFEEFKNLWEILRNWKAAFKKFDMDKNGTMSSFELRNTLNSVGFHIDNATFSSLVLRFANRECIVHFDEYIICCARLRTAFETLKAGNPASYTESQLLNILVYL